MTFLKSFIGHIIITIFAWFILGYGYSLFSHDFDKLIYESIYFCSIVMLYVLSGYVITNVNKKFRIWNYSAIALFGVTIWFICMKNSPDDLNWKNGNGGLWFYHQIYLSGIETTFWFNDTYLNLTLKRPKLQTSFLLILSILPSILQVIGGIMKKRTGNLIDANPDKSL